MPGMSQRPPTALPDLAPVRRRWRRLEQRTYLPESAAFRLREATALPHLEQAQQALGAAPRQSAVRRALQAANIDPALARLVVLFPDDRPLRASEVAWRLGISKPAATRLLDRAESIALIDKLTPAFDRRGVWARLTSKGRRLQHTVQRLVDETAFARRKAGKAYGIRATNPHDPD